MSTAARAPATAPARRRLPPIVHDVLASPGHPVEDDMRAFMEDRFGHDFSSVRVHTDARAAESAQAVSALAYTVGRHIVFGAGRYASGTGEGRRILGHELAHVVQQGGLDALPARAQLRIAGPEEPAEREADAAAAHASTGIVQRLGEPLVQRQQPQGTPPPGPVAQPPEAPKPPAAAAEGSKKVCLTFDDGPEPGTADVLNTLRGRASATFFLTGKNLEKDEPQQAELVGRMLGEGHQIGNHTYSHFPETEPQYQETYGDLKDPAKLARFKQNFIKNREHFERILGDKLPDFPAVARLPGQGQLVRRSGQLIYVKAAQDMGMTHVTWHFEFAPNGVFSRLTPDWMGVAGLAAEWWGRKSKTDTPHQYPRPNDIVLLHDRHWAGQSKLLGAALTKLESGGFTFGKLDREGTCK